VVENGPFGYVSLANGRIEYVNSTLVGWSGRKAEEIIGKPLGEFLTVPGRIYYETHLAPLLRMQRFFEEIAIDFLRADGEALPMIANAQERRGAEGKPVLVPLAFIKATDRRRYEQELVRSREMAKAAAKATEE